MMPSYFLSIYQEVVLFSSIWAMRLVDDELWLMTCVIRMVHQCNYYQWCRLSIPSNIGASS